MNSIMVLPVPYKISVRTSKSPCSVQSSQMGGRVESKVESNLDIICTHISLANIECEFCLVSIVHLELTGTSQAEPKHLLNRPGIIRSKEG